MKRKKIQKLITTVLTVTFLTNTMSTLAFGLTKDTPGTSYADLVQTLRNSENYTEDNTDFISKDIDTTSSDMVSVIVEFVSEPLAVLNANNGTTYSLTENKVDRDHRIFESYLSKIPGKFALDSEAPKITYSYKTIFNGVALSIKGTEVKGLLNSGVVKKIHSDAIVTVDPPVEEVSSEDNEITPFMMDSVPFLGVDDLHDEGINGNGIKVGVLDTGIDYNHPDLTNVYKGFRSEDGDPATQDIDSTIGWDYIDNDADPMETTYSDWLESDSPEFNSNGDPYYTSHGTHVSGTIAGTGDNKEAEIPVLGVAPEIELYSYRVLGHYGSGATSGIISAIEKSVKDGMDVINMSLGSSGGNGPFDAIVTATNNATLAGVVTVISNGNSGPNSFTVGSPGTAQLPIAVGASTVDININKYQLAIGDLKINSSLLSSSYNYKLDDLLNKELDIVYCDLGYPADYEGKDLKGKIAFVDRGILSFLDKAKNAAEAGAEAIIIANNTTETEIPFIGESNGANILAITLDEGNALKKVLDNKVTINANGTDLIKGDEVTSFSSVGPVSQTYEIRPDIVAPGSGVYSAAPEYINDKDENVDNYAIAYQRMSGTSMAAPHIAGIAALILQNNPDYTPTDVKNAIMNTSEHIHKKDGTSYSVHETGAGRVNAFEAVHEKVAFSANYKVTAGEDHKELDNVTGMLSFGKIMAPEEGTISKTIPVTVSNSSATSKSYSIEIEYSDSSRAQDAVKNNVKLATPTEIQVAAGGSETFDVTLSTPIPVEFGTYEGFIHFTEVGAEENTYQMPFSVNIMKDGFANLTYPSVSDGFGQGITAFTSSDLFARNFNTHFGLADITIMLQVNEPIKSIKTFVVDPETKERIGYGGMQETNWLPIGVDVMLENFVPNGKVRKIVNGKISHEEFPVPTGVYKLEVVAEGYDGNEFSEYLPMGIINDTKSDKVTFNMEEGIHEVTEDMYSSNIWYDGEEHEGLWLNANVYNDIVNTLKTEYDLSYLKQEEVNTIFANGTGRDGWEASMGTMSKSDGNILVAGVERADLESGFFRVDLSYANAGKIGLKPAIFTFVNHGSSYLSLDTDTEKISENSTVNSSITLNNGENVVKGSFKIRSNGDAIFSEPTISPSDELKALAGNDIKITTEYNNVNGDWESYGELTVSFELTSSDSSFKGINGDMKLFDIAYTVDSFKGISEDLADDDNFNYITLKGIDGEFKNSQDEAIDVMAGTIYKTLDLEYKERTLIYVQTDSPMRGMKNANAYVIDNAGNRYKPTYLKLDEWAGRNHLFTFNDLPVIDGDYKVILEMPGCFDSVMNVPGSKLNEKGVRVGNTFGVTSYSFYAQSMASYSGDVNGDGAIDIVDATEIGKLYKPGNDHIFDTYSAEGSESSEPIAADLTQDGVVDYYDMFLLLSNYLMQDFTREDSKIPEEYLDGRDITDILESCGYFDEVPERNVILNMDKETSFVGDEVKFSVKPATEEVEFEYEFSVREKNDTDWTVVQERSPERNLNWTSKTAGEYEFRARVFLDEINYVWQDNKFHTVSWADLKGISLDKEILDLNTGDAAELTVSLNPWNAKPQEFVWSSSDEKVATVKDGKIQTLKAGTTTITVKTLDDNFSASCTVNVTDVALESIKISKNTLELKKDEDSKLEVTFMPENATNKNVTWNSADEKIASVVDGKVTGLSAGTTTITVTSEEGNFSDICVVTVKEDPAPPTKPLAEKITLNKNKAKLNVGDKLTLKATISPAEAEMPELTWTSSNKKVATVKDGVITAVGEGKAKITVKSKDGKLSDSCDITVSKKNGGSNLPQTGSLLGTDLLVSAGLMALSVSTLIVVGKKKENEED